MIRYRINQIAWIWIVFKKSAHTNISCSILLLNLAHVKHSFSVYVMTTVNIMHWDVSSLYILYNHNTIGLKCVSAATTARSHRHCQSVVVAVVMDVPGTRMKGNRHVWTMDSSTRDRRECVCVVCVCCVYVVCELTSVYVDSKKLST